MKDLVFDIKGRDKTQAAFDSARRNAKALGGEMDNTGRGMQLAGVAAKAFAAAFTVTAIANFGRVMRDVIADAADLADVADKVGVSIDDLQRMTFGFEQAGVEAGSIEGILTQWSKRLGEASAYGGRLAEIFKANNISLTDSDGRLRSSVDLMREYAELIKNAASDHERQLLAAEAFGRAGSAMVLPLREGAEGLDRIMQATETAGGVFDEKLVRRAAELDDKINAASQTMETYFRGALLRAAADLDALLGAFQAFDPGSASDFALDQRSADIGKERIKIENEILRIRGEQHEITGAFAPIEQRLLDGQIKALQERDALLRAEDQTIVGAFNARAQGDILAGDQAAHDRAFGAGRPTILPSGDKGDRPGGAGRPASREPEISAYERVAEKLREEQELLGLNEVEQRILTEQRRAGVTATSEQGQAIAGVVTSIESEIEHLQRLEAQQQAVNDAMSYLAGGAVDALFSWAEGAQSAEEAARRFGMELAKAVAYAALLGEPMIGGIFNLNLGSTKP